MYRARNRPARTTIRQPHPRMSCHLLGLVGIEEPEVPGVLVVQGAGHSAAQLQPVLLELPHGVLLLVLAAGRALGPRPPRATGSLRAAWTTTGSRAAAGGPAGTRGTERSEYRSALDVGGGRVAARPAGNRPVRAWVQGSRARRRRRGRSLPWATVVGVGSWYRWAGGGQDGPIRPGTSRQPTAWVGLASRADGDIPVGRRRPFGPPAGRRPLSPNRRGGAGLVVVTVRRLIAGLAPAGAAPAATAGGQAPAAARRAPAGPCAGQPVA